MVAGRVHLAATDIDLLLVHADAVNLTALFEINGFVQARRGPVGDAVFAEFALLAGFVKGAEDIGDGVFDAVAVQEVEIDVVGAQGHEAGFEVGHDLAGIDAGFIHVVERGISLSCN